MTLSYPTLSFEDEIFYNVYFTVDDISSVVEMGLMLLPSNMAEATIDDAIGTVPGYLTNGSLFMARSEGIPAAYMGDTVYFKVYAKLTDGTYAYPGAGGYNAKAYANTMLGGSYPEAMKSLVVALGKYCEGKAVADGDAQQAFAQATGVYGYYAKRYFAGIA